MCSKSNEGWEFAFDKILTRFESKIELHLSGSWLFGLAWPFG